MATRAGETLLVNFMECHPVGHVIEGLRFALGHHAGDPSLRISIVLNRASPAELATLCPFIETVYPVHLPVSRALSQHESALEEIPRTWDWIVDNPRRYAWQHLGEIPQLETFFETTDRWLTARRGRGVIGIQPAYRPHQQLRLQLPPGHHSNAQRLLEGAEVRIAVVPAGSGERWLYPSVTSWKTIVGALRDRWPDVRIFLIGKLRRDERTSTTFSAAELTDLSSHTRAVDCFDLPLLDQLAVVEGCDLFLAPHTGFGMAALAVGTPWLAIAGGRYHEYLFNSVPFYSVQPDPDRFGCYTAHDRHPVLEATLTATVRGRRA